MPERGYASGYVPSTTCEGRRPSNIRQPPYMTSWALPALPGGRAAFRGQHREPFSESRMREMRLSGSLSGKRKQSYAKPD